MIRALTFLAALALAMAVLWGNSPPVAWGQGAGSNGAGASRLEVRILPMAEVPGDSFTLGEVAEIDGVELETIRRLADLHLGRSPLPGRELRLNRSLIRSRIARVIDPDKVTLKLPSGAMVVRSARTVPGTDIAAKVLAYAAEKFGAGLAGAAGTDLKQEIVGRVPDAVLPTGEVTWSIDPLGGRLTSGGTHTYKVEAVVGKQVAWRKLVRVRQSVSRDVVIASRSIRRNQVIRASDLEMARKPVGGLKQENFLDKKDLVVGQRAKRPIGKGEWLHAGLIDRLADVPEGGPVTIEYQGTHLSVRVPGVALVPGKLGAFIPVRNLQSGKIVYGVVREGDRVQVN